MSLWDFPTLGARVAAALLCAASLLPASSLQLRFDGTSPSVSIDRKIDGVWYDASADYYILTQLGGTYPNDLLPAGKKFWAFCIEPLQFFDIGHTYTYEVVPLAQGATNIGGMGEARADKIEELFGRFYPVFGVPIDRQHAAALQVAIWEIVREGYSTLDVYHGTTKFKNEGLTGTMSLAQSYLDQLNGQGPHAAGLHAAISYCHQDIVVQDLPEPGTFGLIGLGCLALSLAWKRMRHF